MTQLLSYLATLNKLQESCHARRRRPIYLQQIGSLETQNASYFSLFYNLICFFTNCFWRIFNAISSGKSYLTSMPSLLTHIDLRTVQLFPPSWFWLANSNFRRASRMQGVDIKVITRHFFKQTFLINQFNQMPPLTYNRFTLFETTKCFTFMDIKITRYITLKSNY